MPRQVDHDERRRAITDAVRRVLARGGLQAVTFQSVAKEAGVSVRLVQYYFGTKHDVLVVTHRAVIEATAQRFAGALAALGEDAGPRAVLRAVLLELLPTNEARRHDALALAAFHGAALSGGDLSPDDTGGAAQLLADVIATQLRREGQAAALTAELDAGLLVAAASGLSQAMLVDPARAERAGDLVERLLDRFLAQR